MLYCLSTSRHAGNCDEFAKASLQECIAKVPRPPAVSGTHTTDRAQRSKDSIPRSPPANRQVGYDRTAAATLCARQYEDYRECKRLLTEDKRKSARLF